MTKQILFSLLSLLFIFVSISNALESQDNGLVSNDQVPGEADAVLSEVNSLSEEVASSRLARAAASEARRKNGSSKRKKATKKSEKVNRRNKGPSKRRNKKSGKKRNNSKRKKAGKRRKNSKEKKAGKRRKNSKKEKAKKKKINSSKRKNKKKKKGEKSKLSERQDTDGNTITIVCPECPKTLVCSKSNNRNGKQLSKKEKKMLKKQKKVENMIAKINNRYKENKARNGENEDDENDEDKLCTPCCPVCPECPKTLVCSKSSQNRNGEKLTKKEKRMLKKQTKVENKIAKINNLYQKNKARNGENVNDEDKLCTPCCPPTPTPAPPTGTTAAPPPPPPPPPPPTNCTPCVMHTASVMDVWRFQVTNFEKQKKRVENQKNIATNKASANKTSAFTDLANHLTGLSCAMNMAEIDDTKMKLMECTAQITAACNLTMIDQTFVDECTTKTTDFVTEATKCKDGARKGKSDDCPCFKALFATLSDVKKCKIAETATIATEFKACKAAFSECKKLEDSVGPLVIKGMCGTATTTGAPRLRRKWMFDKLRV